MQYPRWLAKLNRRVFNPGQVRAGKRPVVIHTGRSTGTLYQTPLDALPTTQGYVLVVRYGPDSDWVRNILVAGTATLRIDGEERRLGSPRLVPQHVAADALAAGVEPHRDFFKADHYLLMDHPQERE